MTVMMANRAQILLRPNDRRDEEFGMVQMTFPTYGPMKSPRWPSNTTSILCFGCFQGSIDDNLSIREIHGNARIVRPSRNSISAKTIALPLLTPLSVFELPPSPLMEPRKALPQFRNPLIHRADCSNRLRAKEPRQIHAHPPQRLFLELQTLLLSF